MPNKQDKKISVIPDKTVIKSLALIGLLGGGMPCATDVKDGKIVRIRPLHYDWKYPPEHRKRAPPGRDLRPGCRDAAGRPATTRLLQILF